MAGVTVALASACIVLVLAASPALAHHSYADYVLDEPFAFSGTITAVHWGNPHILLSVDDGTQAMRIEWVTTAGAELTGVAREQLAPGNRITVTGSRHRDPAVHSMTQVKELYMPDHDWRWQPPSRRRSP